MGYPDHLAVEQPGGDAAHPSAPLGPRPLSARQHAGRAGNRDKQRSVLTDTLRAMAAIDGPGGSVELPYRWEADPVMWRGKPLRESSYS